MNNRKTRKSRFPEKSESTAERNRQLISTLFDFSRPQQLEQRRSGVGGNCGRNGRPARVAERDQYVKARFQSVVLVEDKSGEFSWTRTKHVRCFDHQISKCLICLEKTVAAKVTRCGHIFCWHCILRHTAVNGIKVCCQCPACGAIIENCELKSVEQHVVVRFSVGDSIELHHMYIADGDVFDPEAVEKVLGLAKTVYFTKDQFVSQVLLRELNELEEAAKAAANSEDPTESFNLEFIETAKKKCLVLIDRYTAQTKNTDHDQIITNDLTFENRSFRSPGQFYQSSDGQRIFLHPINIRCIQHQFLDPSNYPPIITARIVACETIFMNKENQKRYRFLKHLDLGVECQLVELDLSHLLTQETLVRFTFSLNQRRQEREIRQRRDSDARAMAEMRANQEMKKAIEYKPPPPVVGIQHQEHIAEFPPVVTFPPVRQSAQMSAWKMSGSIPLPGPKEPEDPPDGRPSLADFVLAAAAKKKGNKKRGRRKSKDREHPEQKPK